MQSKVTGEPAQAPCTGSWVSYRSQQDWEGKFGLGGTKGRGRWWEGIPDMGEFWKGGKQEVYWAQDRQDWWQCMLNPDPTPGP